MTYYDILEVSENASFETIRAAYKALAKKYHPDVFSGDPLFANEKIKQINSAYEVLSDIYKRKAYDEELKTKKQQETTKTNTINDYRRDIYIKRRMQRRYAFIRCIPLAIVLLVIILVGIIGDINDKINDPDRNLTPVSEPASGTIFVGSNHRNASQITITAPMDQSCVVKLKTSNGQTKLYFYVRAGDTVTIGVPCQHLYVYFACGKTWYGNENLFGSKTTYSMDSSICDFSNYTWEYTLQKTQNGNFSQKYINENDFK